MEMKPKYNPSEVESGRYDQWVNNGYFKAQKIILRKHIQSLFHHQM